MEGRARCIMLLWVAPSGSPSRPPSLASFCFQSVLFFSRSFLCGSCFLFLLPSYLLLNLLLLSRYLQYISALFCLLCGYVCSSIQACVRFSCKCKSGDVKTKQSRRIFVDMHFLLARLGNKRWACGRHFIRLLCMKARRSGRELGRTRVCYAPEQHVMISDGL